MMKKYFFRFLMISFALFLVSCSSGAGRGKGSVQTPPDINPGNVTPVTVTMITPTNGATNVSLIPGIQLRFNMPVTQVNSTNVTLHEGSQTGKIVAISQITAGNSNTYTFSPSVALQQSTKYYVVLNNKIVNSSGLALSATSFNFTTGSFSPPEASLISPNNGATNVSLNPSIQLQFSESVESVNSNNVTLHEGSETGKVVAISQITAGSDNTYTFNSISELRQSSKYYIVLSSKIISYSGVSLVPTNFTFTTGNFTTPGVNMISPTDNAINVSLNPNIQLKFSMHVQNVNGTNVTLHEASESGAIVAIGAITAGGDNIYTFSPTQALNPTTKYYVILNNGITNDAGVALSPTEFSFTTGDFTTPVASIISPTNNSIGVDLNPSIQIQFSMQVLNVNDQNVTLHEGGESGTVVAIGTITSGNNNNYTFRPNSSLNQLTKYYVVLSNGITNISGVALSPTSFSFTTGDFTQPQASMISPSNGATGVSVYTTILLQFNVPVLNVNSSNVVIHKDTIDGPVVSIDLISPGAQNTYTLSGTTFDIYTTYYVELSGGITTLSGIGLTPTSFSFTTGAGSVRLIGAISQTDTISIGQNLEFYNDTGDDVTISQIIMSGDSGDFAAAKVDAQASTDTCTGQTILNHGNCQFTVSDVPRMPGSVSTIVYFTVNYYKKSGDFLSNTFPIIVSFPY